MPDSGVLPALELAALLPWTVLAGAALWLVLTLSLLLVHHGICRIVGGPQVSLRRSGMAVAGAGLPLE